MMNGKLAICVGRVVKAKQGIMLRYGGLMRVYAMSGSYALCKDETSSTVKTKKDGKRSPRLFHIDDLMVAK